MKKQFLINLIVTLFAIQVVHCQLYSFTNPIDLSSFSGFKNTTPHGGVLIQDPVISNQKAISFIRRVTTSQFDIYTPPIKSNSGCYVIQLDYYGKTASQAAALIGISNEDFTGFQPVFASSNMYNLYNTKFNPPIVVSLNDSNSWQTSTAAVCVSKTIKIRVGISDGYYASYNFGNFFIKNLIVSDEQGQILNSVVGDQQEKFSYYSTQTYSLMNQSNLNTWSTTNRTKDCNGYQIFPGPNNIMSQEPYNMSPAEVKLSFYDLKPHYNKTLSFEVFIIGTWSQNLFFVSINDQRVFTAQVQDSFFDQSTTCGSKSPVGVKKFLINIPIKSNANQFTVKFSSNLNQGDYTSSFGIRNITLIQNLCTPLCQSCKGPDLQDCFSCVPNTYLQNLIQCQCLIGYTTQPMNKYVCSAMPLSNSSSQNCKALNALYSNQLEFNYYCAYDNESQSHNLAVTLFPKYNQLNQCFSFKMMAVSPTDDTKATEVGPLTFNSNQSDSDTIKIAIPHDKMSNLNCLISEDSQFITYQCKMQLVFYQDTNIDTQELCFFWDVKLTNNLQKTTSLITEKKLYGTHYCLNSNDPLKCIEQIYPNASIAQYLNYSSTDQNLYNQLTANNLTITIYTKIYAQIILTDPIIASQYYPIVKQINIQCSNPQNEDNQVEFQILNTKLGSTVVSYYIAVKGFCQPTYTVQLTLIQPLQSASSRILTKNNNFNNETNLFEYKFQTFKYQFFQGSRILQDQQQQVFNNNSISNNETVQNNTNSNANSTKVDESFGAMITLIADQNISIVDQQQFAFTLQNYSFLYFIVVMVFIFQSYYK